MQKLLHIHGPYKFPYKRTFTLWFGRPLWDFLSLKFFFYRKRNQFIVQLLYYIPQM